MKKKPAWKRMVVLSEEENMLQELEDAYARKEEWTSSRLEIALWAYRLCLALGAALATPDETG